jgi:hypothetical protein
MNHISQKQLPEVQRREMESERETAYLLKSETMKRRLLEAKERQHGISLEEACEKLGVGPFDLELRGEPCP